MDPIPLFRTRWFATAFLLVAFSLVPRITQAQNVSFRGRIVDADGNPLAGVVVTIAGSSVRATSSASGTFVIAVPPGSYNLRASLVGYSTRSFAVNVVAGQSSTAEMMLLAIGETPPPPPP